MEFKELWKLGKENGIQQIESEWKEVLDLVTEKDTVIEIGSYSGGSTFTLAEKAKEVISIEPKDRWSVGNYENIKKFTANSKDCVEDVKEYLGRRKANVLIIDGDHSEKGVLTDYELYLPLVKKGGAIIFHDIVDSADHRRQLCYVSKAWEKIKEGKDVLEIIDNPTQNWAGLGVIFKD